MTLTIRLKQWKALTPIQQSQINAVCGDNIRHGLVEGSVRKFDKIKQISGRGTNIQRLPADVLFALSAAWVSIAETEANNDREFSEVWKSLSNFRRDYDIWDELSSM